LIVFGTGGHATELLEELIQLGVKDIFFYNDVNPKLIDFNGYKVLKSRDQLIKIARTQFNFVLGLGKPILRQEIQKEWMQIGGIPTSVISKNAIIGKFDVELGLGLNVMSGVHISSDVSIGDGCLINRNANIHHGVRIDDFCEIAPNAVLLGNVEIGGQTFIGTGAIVLPGVKIGNNCVIGAGSVVTKDLASNSVVKGNPAK
jgi:sugar O-acyltransferase (sialic acid O-acetyltransferase NeuD family)